MGEVYLAHDTKLDREVALKTLLVEPNDQYMLQVAGHAYARSGRYDDARELIGRFCDIAGSQYAISFFVATIYAGIGQRTPRLQNWRKGFAIAIGECRRPSSWTR